MIALAREKGMPAIADTMLEKLVGVTTHAHRPAVVAAVRSLILQTSVEATVAALAAMRDRPDAAKQLPRVACPTLVIVGEEDALSPPALAESIAQAIPRAARGHPQSRSHVEHGGARSSECRAARIHYRTVLTLLFAGSTAHLLYRSQPPPSDL